MSKTIVFFGTDEFSAASLRALIEAGFSIGGVVTKPDSRQGRGRELTAPIVKQIAEQHDIPVWQPEKITDITEAIQSLGDVAGVLVSFGKIIPQSVIDLFQPGIINVHPSLLPRYRGPSPIETAIRNGDSETGVSIMQLSAAMDAGPVYQQTVTPLKGSETAPQLESQLAAEGAAQLVAILPAILDGSLRPVTQNDDEATYCQMLQKSDSTLDPTTITAIEAERRVRAHLVFPKTKVTVLGHSIVITKAHVSTETSSILDIACSEGFLSIDELIGPSGRTMDAAAFLRGYSN